MFDSDNDYDNNIHNLDQDDIIPSNGTLQNLTYILFNIFRRSFNYYLNQASHVVYNSVCVAQTLDICCIHSLSRSTITKKL